MTLRGADSETARPGLYDGLDVWGIYPATWTREEVAALTVERVLPIVVATEATLQPLYDLAVAFGIPEGGPLVVDIEEDVAQAIGPVGIQNIDTTHHELWGGKSWIYGGDLVQANVAQCLKWLAQWPKPAGDYPSPEPTAIPAGYAGWQFAGNVSVNGQLLDFDLFDPAQTYMTPQLGVIGPAPAPQPPEVDYMKPFLAQGTSSNGVSYWAVVRADLSWAVVVPNGPDGTALVKDSYSQLPTPLPPAFIDDIVQKSVGF